MTELYKKNGSVFIPVSITLEEVEELKDDNKVMADNYSKMEQKFYDNFTNAKELIKKLVNEFYYLCELYNFATDYECLAEADQFIREVRSE